MILTRPSQIRDLLARVRTVAMVGASSNPLRPSYTVFSYLRTQTPYDVTPINPTLTEIDGIAAYPTLGAKAIWFQYGVINDEAIALADRAGLDVVVDRCMKVENARFCGGLSTSGLNSGLITSRRPII